MRCSIRVHSQDNVSLATFSKFWFTFSRFAMESDLLLLSRSVEQLHLKIGHFNKCITSRSEEQKKSGESFFISLSSSSYSSIFLLTRFFPLLFLPPLSSKSLSTTHLALILRIPAHSHSLLFRIKSSSTIDKKHLELTFYLPRQIPREDTESLYRSSDSPLCFTICSNVKNFLCRPSFDSYPEKSIECSFNTSN